jgi:hypothetical protein
MSAVRELAPGHHPPCTPAPIARPSSPRPTPGPAASLPLSIGAAAGLLPAIRAARLCPTQALWSLCASCQAPTRTADGGQTGNHQAMCWCLQPGHGRVPSGHPCPAAHATITTTCCSRAAHRAAVTGLRPADIRWSARFPLLWVPRPPTMRNWSRSSKVRPSRWLHVTPRSVVRGTPSEGGRSPRRGGRHYACQQGPQS